MKDFTNLYSLSKTLRFELKPQGKTLEHITKNGFLLKDKELAEKYKLLKKIIDEYHKKFIDEALQGLQLSGLQEYVDLYSIHKKDKTQKKLMEDVQKKLRKQAADRFSKSSDEKVNKQFKNLFKKELFSIDLPAFIESPHWSNAVNKKEELACFRDINCKNIILEFNSFTTYFTGFHENRENMYSAEDKSTAIAFRLIHQNLPKFIDNMDIFEKIKNSPVRNKFDEICARLEEVIQVNAIDDFFEMDSFNTTLTQTGIDQYNTLIGGYAPKEQGEKVQGINEYINEYNQLQKEKKDKIPKLKPLYKQILSDRGTASWLPEKFESDQEVLESLEKMYQEIKNAVLEHSDNKARSLPDLLQNIESFDLNGIFIKNGVDIANLSQAAFKSYNFIENSWLKENGIETLKTISKKEALSRQYKVIETFSLEDIIHIAGKERKDQLLGYFTKMGEVEAEDGKKTHSIPDKIKTCYDAAEDILKSFPDSEKLIENKEAVKKIKDLLDSIISLFWYVKPLLGKGDTQEGKDNSFYSEFAHKVEMLGQIVPLYSKVRNYMTKKPYSIEKYKLNFENSTLLNGWDKNKETANTSVLFKRGDLYYLGIMDKEHNKIFENFPQSKANNSYQKVLYKLLPGPNKMLPKVFFSDKNIKEYNPSEKILYVRNHSTHTKNGLPQEGYEKEPFNIADCREMVDFYKSSIERHPEWKTFAFKFSPASEYDSIDKFYREVEQQGYSISFINIDQEYIDQMVEEGKLYLFQIYNKDFSPFSKGRPNMHTLYWKMLFDEANLESVVYKLNGQAEIFYRKASLTAKNPTHRANSPIENKNSSNKKKNSIFKYDLVKDKRFTEDKFQFHVPITLNFKGRQINDINERVNEAIQNNKVEHIIGIDRGERNLLYLTMIDMDGKIVLQHSFNTIHNEFGENTYETNYHDLLSKRERNRDESRKSWDTIEKIKDIKEGYLSQVVHKVATLMVEHKAIVALEELNMGFKRGRQKVEKQVYQKFEKMLIDKLNYYIDKKKDPSELTGTLNALQLTNQFESFDKLGKQSGYLFYVPAWNTSKLDPVTGFVNFLNTSYESVKEAQKLLRKFDSISFNADKMQFEFALNYSNFTEKAEGTKTRWTIVANNEIRYYRDKSLNNNMGGQAAVKICEELENLLGQKKINYGEGKNLIESICRVEEADFYKSLLRLLTITLSLRHNNGEKGENEEDFILSPVADNNHEFFDSRKERAKGKEDGKWISKWPTDADANGAFNIARKGLLLVERIKKASDLKKVDLLIPNKEWLAFVQK